MTTKSKLDVLRANFCAFLAREGNFFTLALLSTVRLECKPTQEAPAKAWCRLGNEGMTIGISEELFDLPLMQQYFVFHHEVFHIRQMADYKNVIDLVDWHGIDAKSRQFIMNLALDGALHEHLAKLYGDKVWQDVKDSLNVVSYALFRTWKDFPSERLPPMADFVLAAQVLSDYYKSQQPECQNFDTHDISATNVGDLSDACERALEACERAEAEAKRMAHDAGTEARDLIIPTKAGKLSDQLKKTLRLLRTKMTRLSREKQNTFFDFAALNRTWGELDYLPGHLKVSSQKPQVILIIDTSGSMCEDALLQKMVGVALELKKQDKLAAIYCGDTEYRLIETKDNLNSLPLVGGGGTVLLPEHLESMARELRVSRRPEFVYLTDGEVNGIDKCRADSRWNLHIILDSQL